MPSYPLHALVLRKTKLGETDLIVSLLADDGRHVRAVAKGARKPGGRLTGKVEPCTVVDLLVHSGKSLEVVQEARMTSPHATLREDFERANAAAVVIDVVDRMIAEGDPEPRLFALAVAMLDALEEFPEESIGRLVAGFLVKAMAMHGYKPELEACVACASETACVPSEAGTVRFSLDAGGLICAHCGALDATVLMLPAQAPEWLSFLLRSTLAEIADAEMPSAAVVDTLEVMRAFIAYHVGSRSKALDFFCAHLPVA